MNISGVLVRSYPKNLDAVRACLEELAGVDVHEVDPTAVVGG